MFKNYNLLFILVLSIINSAFCVKYVAHFLFHSQNEPGKRDLNFDNSLKRVRKILDSITEEFTED